MLSYILDVCSGVGWAILHFRNDLKITSKWATLFACQSVCIQYKQNGGSDFREMFCWRILFKYVHRFQFLLKCDVTLVLYFATRSYELDYMSWMIGCQSNDDDDEQTIWNIHTLSGIWTPRFKLPSSQDLPLGPHGHMDQMDLQWQATSMKTHMRFRYTWLGGDPQAALFIMVAFVTMVTSGIPLHEVKSDVIGTFCRNQFLMKVPEVLNCVYMF
jgi:hypothetical protein